MTPLQRLVTWLLAPEKRADRRQQREAKRAFKEVIGPRCPECGKQAPPNSYCSEKCEYDGTIWMAA